MTDAKSLKAKWRSMTANEKQIVADKAGTSVAYLRQVLACGRKPGAAMAKKIEVATERNVSRVELLPEIFSDL